MNIFARLGSLGFLDWVLLICCVAFFTLVGNQLFKSNAQIVHLRLLAMNFVKTGTEDEKKMQDTIFKRIKMMMEERIQIYLKRKLRDGKLKPLKAKLEQANDSMDPIQHWTQKCMYAIGMSALGLFAAALGIQYANVPVIVGMALLGFVLPDMRLNEKLKKRQHRLKTELPDFLDLLASTAPSAKNLEDAIRKVCDRSEGEITREFRMALERVNTGIRTRDALKQMSDRCGVLEIEQLISQINQAEAYGTGVEKTLLIQAEKMRKLKRLMAETKARKSSVLLILPSLFLLITCLIMIAGPSVVSIFEAQSMFAGGK